MSNDYSAPTYRTIDHVVALARIIDAAHDHIETDVKLLTWRYTYDIRAFVAKEGGVINVADVALLLLSNILRSCPTVDKAEWII